MRLTHPLPTRPLLTAGLAAAATLAFTATVQHAIPAHTTLTSPAPTEGAAP